MIRITIAASMIVGLGATIPGDPNDDETAAAARHAPAPAIAAPSPALEAAAPIARPSPDPQMSITTASGEVIPIAMRLSPGDLGAGVIRVAAPDPAALAVEIAARNALIRSRLAASAEQPRPDASLFEVAGNAVNLRARPSAEAVVLGTARHGAQARRIEDMGNGWSRIEIVETGQTGFMATRFLRAAAP